MMQATLRRLFPGSESRSRNFARRDWSAGPSTAIETLEDRLLLTMQIVFDYSLDTSGYFAANPQAKTRLEEAGAELQARIQDTLAEVKPSGGNTWSIGFTHPSTGNGHTVQNPTIANDVYLIYAGGQNIGPRDGQGNITLALGGNGVAGTASGTQEWINLTSSRGQAGALQNPPTDIGAWGGSISINTHADANWYYGTDTAGLTGQNSDFYSTVLHELVHAIGFGSSSVDNTPTSWTRHITNGFFTGAAATAANGGFSVPVSGTGHWAQTVMSDGRQPLMVPSASSGAGQRDTMTTIDWAGLQDVGWQIGPAATPTALSIQLAQAQVGEAAGATATSFTVTRTGSTAAALTVQLTSSNTGRATVPATVTIAAGQTVSPAVNVSVIDNQVADGNAQITIAAAATGATGGQAQLTVTDDDATQQPALSIQLAATQVGEAGGAAATTFTVTRTGNTTAALTVQLTSSSTGRATVPTTVTIAAGQTVSPAVNVSVIDNQVADGNAQVTITATATGLTNGLAVLTVTDDDGANPGTDLFDIDLNGVADALGDGILGLRYIAGFRGDQLINGTVSANSQRNTAAAIEAHIANQVLPGLDADDDLQTQPLSDGVLFLRYLAGFTGTTLTAGVANPQGNRTNPADIVTWYADYRKPLAGLEGEFGAVPTAPVRLASTRDAAIVAESIASNIASGSRLTFVSVRQPDVADVPLDVQHDVVAGIVMQTVEPAFPESPRLPNNRKSPSMQTTMAMVHDDDPEVDAAADHDPLDDVFSIIGTLL